MDQKYILFFDGVCGLCNSLVNFMVRVDRRQKYRYAPIQGEYGKSILSEKDRLLLQSVIVVSQGHVFRKSSAVLRLLMDLGGPWKLFGVGYCIPVFLRDYIYDFIAQHRYQWFGEKESCRIPSESERHLFL